MAQVIIASNGEQKTVSAAEGTLLSALLQQAQIPLSMPCSGNHTCGKCRVKAQGALSEMESREEAMLSPADLANGVRLACFTRVLGDCTVTVDTGEAGSAIQSSGRMEGFTLSPRVNEGYGLAVDIGTTTVVAYLYRLSDGSLASVRSGMNAQRGFGADVISRINYANEHGVAALQQAIVSQLKSLAEQTLADCGAGMADLRDAVITGNTTMLHLLTGLDPYGIAVYPFTPVSLFGEPHARDLLGFEATERVYLPHCITSYIGADITCSILSSGMMERETALLIDLGTNGEMALRYKGKLFCCSTAAGPAFEGAGMQMGMTAVNGAVSKVSMEGERMTYSVIGGGEAKGLCGSGVIDAVAAFVRCGLIDDTGRIDEDSPLYAVYGTEFDGFPALKIGDSGVLITQQDIRKLQLAKSAVAAGVLTMLSDSGCTMDEISTLYLAGGFGSYVDIRSAAAIGLIPEALAGKVTVIGNAAGAGASMLLLDRSAEEREQAIVSCAEEINLSANPTFMDHYVEQMMF